MKNTSINRSLAPLIAFVTSCGGDPIEGPTPTFDFDFSSGTQGWVAQFADYPAGREADYDLESGHREVPAPLDDRSGFFLSGDNHSDDLFMFLKRRVDGLEPNTEYRVSFLVEFATDAPTGCTGAGGSPGESVYVKAGASDVEPTTAVDQDGLLRMNVDIGEQSESGANAVVIGNVANSTLCDDGIRRYELKELRGDALLRVITDANGSVWLLVGTDSGFEGVTSVYYTRISAEFAAA